MATETEIQLPDEFASTMQQLVAEAAKTIPPMPEDFAHDVVKPGELSALTERISGLERLIDHRFDELADSAPLGSDVAEQLRRMEEHMAAVRNTESVNQRLFNSLHDELKSYRDNFLRESLQKPFIRDLVVLFDDLTGLAAQMETASGTSKAKSGVITQWRANLDNAIHSLVEVLHRMEVNEIEPKDKVDRAFHRVVSYEPADNADEDGRIVTRIKRGFVWRDQVLRPEEVVAKRFN